MDYIFRSPVDHTWSWGKDGIALTYSFFVHRRRNVYECGNSWTRKKKKEKEDVKEDLKHQGIRDGETRKLDREALRGIVEAAMCLNGPE
jgi:hypothetical protein